MLNYDPEKRISADMALNDIWITKYSHSSKIGSEHMLASMNQLHQFKAQSGLQKAVLAYMTSHFISAEQEQKAREVFEMLDANGDGQLSKDELLQGYKIILNGDIEEAKKQVDELMMQVDMNKNGTVDYKGIFLISFPICRIFNDKL